MHFTLKGWENVVDTSMVAIPCTLAVYLIQFPEDPCLAAHNAKRALHEDTPPMEWDETLAEGAQEWADHLMKNVGHLQHASSEERDGAGENLYWTKSSEKGTCPEAVQAW